MGQEEKGTTEDEMAGWITDPMDMSLLVVEHGLQMLRFQYLCWEGLGAGGEGDDRG